MRVLHIVESLAAGGVETTFLNVLGHFPASMTNDVLAFSGGALESEFRSAARQVSITSSDQAIETLLVSGRYDVAHILFERCASRVLPVLVTRTSTAVVYGKNYDFSGQWRTTEGYHFRADDSMMAACDGVTFTTPQLADGYDKTERDRAVILGKGADVVPLLDIPPAHTGTPDRILVIANPNPRKRIGDLIEALSLVRETMPTVTLRVLGGGDATEALRLRQLANQRGVGSAFELAGVSRDVASELAAARIVALASGSEGVPTALLEGMAAARPIVTTDAGHVRSIVDDGLEGFVVPIGDVTALASRFQQLLADPALATIMGERGRARARGHAVQAIALRLASFLESHSRH